MDQTRPHRTSLLQLAAQWKLLALMAVAKARRIVRGQRLGARGALTEAQLLEAWLQMAILQVNAEIAGAPEGPLTADEQDALDLLKTIAVGLMILLVAIWYLSGEMRVRDEAWLALTGPASTSLVILRSVCAPRNFVRLDPG